MAAERKVGKVRWFSAPTGRPAVNLSFSFRTPSTSSTGKWNNRGKGELLSQAQERVLLYGCEPLSISLLLALYFLVLRNVFDELSRISGSLFPLTLSQR